MAGNDGLRSFRPRAMNSVIILTLDVSAYVFMVYKIFSFWLRGSVGHMKGQMGNVVGF